MDFKDRLRIRETSHHKRCSECTKHQVVMRKLTNHREALAAQSALWARHLDKQYEDRLIYWSYRAASRLGVDEDQRPTLTLILDSMDRTKWMIPRSAAFASKELAGLNRPSLDLTRCIVHGKMLCRAARRERIIVDLRFDCKHATQFGGPSQGGFERLPALHPGRQLLERDQVKRRQQTSRSAGVPAEDPQSLSTDASYRTFPRRH